MLSCVFSISALWHISTTLSSSGFEDAIQQSVIAQRCDSVEFYSFGNPLLTEILGIYKPIPNVTHENHPTYQCDTNGKVLWWTLFGGEHGRWSIGTEIGNDGTAIAYKDSEAFHPSEITRRWRPWNLFLSDKNSWEMDESIEFKCENKKESAFQYKGDYCWNIGITNTNYQSKRNNVGGFDYILQKNKQLNDRPVYFSYSNKLYMFYYENHWVISRQDKFETIVNQESPSSSSSSSLPNVDSLKAYIKSDALSPHLIEMNDNWHVGGSVAPFMSVHCDNPGPQYYYKKIKTYFENEMVVVEVTNNGEQSQEAVEESDFATFWQSLVSLRNGLSNNVLFEQLMSTLDLSQREPWNVDMCDETMRHFCWNNNSSRNGVKIPSVSVGTAGLANDRDVIKWAVNDFGYEMIDSASDNAPWYQNEYLIADLNKRNQEFRNKKPMVTTKLFSHYHGLTRSIKCIEDSLNSLKMDRIDSYLIHHPQCDSSKDCDGTWKTTFRVMEEYWLRGVFSPMIGISNFELKEFNELCDWTLFAPISVIQNWFDPIRQNDWNLIESAKEFGIIFQAYSLLGTQHSMRHNGVNPVLTNEKLQKIGEKYNKSVAQIVLRWALQHGISVIPRSSNHERIGMNIDLFDFQLNHDEMTFIDGMSQK